KKVKFIKLGFAIKYFTYLIYKKFKISSMESKTVNKTLNLSTNPSADFADIQSLLEEGWSVKEVHSNVEQAGGKNLLYITFTLQK
ncbi:MAG: hypothetical protein AAF734_04165, partial [Bacteroidota bacterium]